MRLEPKFRDAWPMSLEGQSQLSLKGHDRQQKILTAHVTPIFKKGKEICDTTAHPASPHSLGR